MQNLDNGIIGLQCLCFVPVGALIKYHWHATVMYVGYRGTSLCLDPGVWVAGGDLCGKAAKAGSDRRGAETKTHWRVEGSRPIGSRVKRLAQGEFPHSPCPERLIIARRRCSLFAVFVVCFHLLCLPSFPLYLVSFCPSIREGGHGKKEYRK